MKKISVITINYNNKEGLKKTIESVASQTCQCFEYIVIDGGSTDGSIDIIRQYEKYINYWISEPDQGIYHAMNKGIAVAKGEYSNFLNSGDYYYNSDVLSNVQSSPNTTDIIVGSLQPFHTFQQKNYLEKTRTPKTTITCLDLFTSSINHPSSFIKTQLLKNNNYDESLKIVSDWKFFFEEVILKNRSYSIIDLIISYFDTTGCSSDLSNSTLIAKERNKVLEALLPYRIRQDYIHMSTGKTKLEKYLVISNPQKTFYQAVTIFAGMLMSFIKFRDYFRKLR